VSGPSAVLRGTGPALAAPIVYRLAARLEQVPVQELLEDPATAAFVLRSAQDLFGLPLVVNHFQLGLEVEAPGAPLARDGLGLPAPGQAVDAPLSAGTADSELLAAAVDVVARLSSELRGSAQVLGVLTGPATLAALLGGSLDGVPELYAVMARRYAEAGAAGVLLAERPGSDEAVAAGTLAELANICRYYSVGSILLAPSAAAPAGPVDLALGTADVLPAELLRRLPQDDAGRWSGRHGLLLTSGEVPADADPGTVTAWIDLLGNAPRGVRR